LAPPNKEEEGAAGFAPSSEDVGFSGSGSGLFTAKGYPPNMPPVAGLNFLSDSEALISAGLNEKASFGASVALA
jgi:hypothetical protein